MREIVKPLRSVFEWLPGGLRDRLRIAVHDARTRSVRRELFGDQAELIPPTALMHDGRQDYLEFRRDGEHYLDLFTRVCGLEPSQRVLDVGSGMGRKAVPLLGYLDDAGSYEGIDVVDLAVRWCRTRITARRPNFRFQHVDVQNGMYRTGGAQSASRFRFPFPDAEFDLVIIISVLTHMLPGDVLHYTREVGRVLKPGGKAFITHFLLNADSESRIAGGQSDEAIVHPFAPGCKVRDVAHPELAIGYQEEYAVDVCREAGMTTEVYPGSWCGRSDSLSYQDVILGERVES